MEGCGRDVVGAGVCCGNTEGFCCDKSWTTEQD